MAKRDYALVGKSANRRLAAPALHYLPQNPKRYNPPIGLIGCGGITEAHLRAYKSASYNVVALCNPTLSKAKARQKEFYPKADLYTDHRKLLEREDIEVVDIATHPEERVEIMRNSIKAGKHVLSQKPFVTDLTIGQELVTLAKQHNVKLAVNQNGRWAPHFSYIRQAIAKNLIGQPFAAHLAVHWDHNWIKNTPFDNVHHILLYDFGIHWFDILSCFMGDQTAKRVYASTAHSPSQKAKPPMLAQALIEYENAQATLVFDADVKHGPQDTTFVAGPKGTLISQGTSLTQQAVTLHTKSGYAKPKLKGSWFTNGFHGAMSELLLAIEQKREPTHAAANNLKSLALCFAACHSAQTQTPVVPGTVNRLDE